MCIKADADTYAGVSLQFRITLLNVRSWLLNVKTECDGQTGRCVCVVQSELSVRYLVSHDM